MFIVLADTFRQISPQQMWSFIGLGVMALIYVTIVRPMMRRKRDPLDRGPAFSSISQQRATERQMQNLLVELSEMARQVSAQLDTRAARLDQLITQADERIAQLKSINQGAAASSAAIESSSPEAAVAVEPPGTAEPPDPRHADIYSLADEGRDAHQIATQLGRPSGEVELILALRCRQRTTTDG
jgi:hypothetical protein